MTSAGAQGKKIAIFVSSFGDGGVEHMLINLANGFTDLGLAVSLIVKREHGDFFHRLSPAVRVHVLAAGGTPGIAQELANYLREEQPDVAVAGKEQDFGILRDAKIRLHDCGRTRFFIMVGGVVSALWRLKWRNPLSTWLCKRNLRKVLNGVDGVIANAAAVAEDLVDFINVSPDRICTAPNPTITGDIASRIAAPVEHPWFDEVEPPIVMGIGRLARVKDFPTLIRAFALLRAQRPCRLMILGRGRQQRKLIELANALGLAEDVHFPGFVDNPLGYLAKANLFVLSSLSEGSPNVLIEALAAGVPVVSTDCSGGVHEILDNGRFGEVTPKRDPKALAQAMARTLDNPLPSGLLRQAAEPFTVEHSCRAHLLAFGLLP